MYCEIDSVMPEKPEFEFLRDKKFRIKTMKMAGVISEGICFPISILSPGDYQIDDDVTDIIGVKQYEPTMDNDKEAVEIERVKRKYPKWLMRYEWFRKLVLPKKQVGEFPAFIHKTDEPRIQNCAFYLTDKTPMIATEKIDGSSATYVLVRKPRKFWRETYEYMVCSRNLHLLKKDKSVYWQISDKYDIRHVLGMLMSSCEWVAIQGEIISPKIQKNKYKVTEPQFYVFNLIYPWGRMDSKNAKALVESLGMTFVPIVNDSYVLPDTVDEVLEYAHGKSALNEDSLREGLVIRSQDGKQSFKAVDPLFLIKYDE